MNAEPDYGFGAVALVIGLLVGGLGMALVNAENEESAYGAGLEDGMMPADYAFQAGAMWQRCGGFDANPDNLTAECRAWFTSFCEDHPALAKDGCKAGVKP